MLSGESIWFPHKDDGFRSGVVHEIRENEKEDVVVVLDCETKEIVEFPLKVVQKRDDKNRMATHDMSSMSQLSDSSILENLRQRYSRDQIYTNIGNILVAVNPYRHVKATINEKAPGILRTVCNIYDDLLENKENHSCVVTGESGAGKTESVRMFINQLASLSMRRALARGTALETNDDDEVNQFTLQDRLIQAGPILESFGNAKTVRNNNSSRFGKWIEIEIDFMSGQPLSGMICNYLLEKSRITSHSDGERNFHIFYQVLTDNDLCDRYGIGGDRKFKLLNGKAPNSVGAIDDTGDFQNLNMAFETMGFQQDEADFVYRTVFSVLLLGQVEFESDADGGTVVKNGGVLEQAADLVLLDSKQLVRAITIRTLRMGQSQESISKPRTLEEARVSLEALIKALYHAIFTWVTERINISLDNIADSIEAAAGLGEAVIESGSIGILDAFGFEIFDTNSFEQLCINYCNEKMQLHFNRLVFEHEIEAYLREEILTEQEAHDFKLRNSNADGSIDKCLRMIEGGKGFGIFALIDDELRLPNGSDEKLLRKMIVKHQSECCFDVPSKKRSRSRSNECSDDNKFIVNHYAGSVVYSIDGFLNKSSDPLPEEIKLLCASSQDAFLQNSFPTLEEIKEESKGRKVLTLGTQFKDQLSKLTEMIFEEATPHFIRCIKPNDKMKPLHWNGARVLQQIRYAGLLEATQVRARGFPVRQSFEEFFKSFGVFALSSTKGLEDEPSKMRALCDRLESQCDLDASAYRIGKTTVFLTQEEHKKLQVLRRDRFAVATNSIQRVVRGHAARKLVAQFKVEIARLLAAMDSKEDPRRIESALRTANAMFPVSCSLENRAKSVSDALRKQALVCDKIMYALHSRQWTELTTFLLEYHSFDRGSDESNRNPTIEEAKNALAQHERNMQDIQDANQRLESLPCNEGELSKQRKSALVLVKHIRDSLPTLIETDEEVEQALQSTLDNCRDVEKNCSAFVIQAFWKRRLWKQSMRKVFGPLRQVVHKIKIGIEARQTSDIDKGIEELGAIGFGSKSSTPHPIVFEAEKARASIALQFLASKNQLQILVKRLENRIIASERQLEQGGAGKSPPTINRNKTSFQPAKRKKSKIGNMLRNTIRWGGNRKAQVRKSEQEYLDQAIKKYRDNGADDSDDIIQHALSLAQRLEDLRQRRRSMPLRLFSSSSLMSHDASSKFYDEVQSCTREREEKVDDSPKLVEEAPCIARTKSRSNLKRSSKSNLLRNLSVKRLLPRKLSASKQQVEEQDPDDNDISNDDESVEEFIPSPRASETLGPMDSETANQLAEESFPKPPMSPIPGVSSSMQRAFLDRLARESEMRKVIESRYWEDRRGVSGVIAAKTKVNREAEISARFESFQSTDSNATVREDCIHPVKAQRPRSIELSVGNLSTVCSQKSTISKSSTSAYKQHWENLAYVNQAVICTKTF